MSVYDIGTSADAMSTFQTSPTSPDTSTCKSLVHFSAARIFPDDKVNKHTNSKLTFRKLQPLCVQNQVSRRFHRSVRHRGPSCVEKTIRQAYCGPVYGRSPCGKASTDTSTDIGPDIGDVDVTLLRFDRCDVDQTSTSAQAYSQVTTHRFGVTTHNHRSDSLLECGSLNASTPRPTEPTRTSISRAVVCNVPSLLRESSDLAPHCIRAFTPSSPSATDTRLCVQCWQWCGCGG